MQRLGHTAVGPHSGWATRQLGHTAVGPHVSWATRQLGHTSVGPHGGWATRQLGHAVVGLQVVYPCGLAEQGDEIVQMNTENLSDVIYQGACGSNLLNLLVWTRLCHT